MNSIMQKTCDDRPKLGTRGLNLNLILEVVAMDDLVAFLVGSHFLFTVNPPISSKVFMTSSCTVFKTLDLTSNYQNLLQEQSYELEKFNPFHCSP